MKDSSRARRPMRASISHDATKPAVLRSGSRPSDRPVRPATTGPNRIAPKPAVLPSGPPPAHQRNPS